MTSSNFEEQKGKMQEFTTNTQVKLQEMSDKTKESMDNVKLQLMNYSAQIQEYLTKINAEVKNYKFVAEKRGDDTVIDIAFKANIGLKE